MLSKAQDQNAKEGSTAIQAGGNVTITQTGLTVTEVRNVALDVFRSNFFELAGTAKKIAEPRGEQITDLFLSKLQEEFPAGLDKSHDPDFQYALFSVQREYARSGDKDLGDLLVDLLVDRSKQEQRDILQIVLNESLITAPKLTESQLAALTIKFVLQYSQSVGVQNHKMLGVYLDKFVEPFATKLVKNQACYQHLEFCGCGSISALAKKLESILRQSYGGLFVTGFDKTQVDVKAVSIGLDSRFFVPCLNHESHFQVKARSQEALSKKLEEAAVSAEDRVKIMELFAIGKMSEGEIKERFISIRPYMAGVFDTWADSPMKSFRLTSVGIAIGHANVKRLVGEFADLSIWIN